MSSIIQLETIKITNISYIFFVKADTIPIVVNLTIFNFLFKITGN